MNMNKSLRSISASILAGLLLITSSGCASMPQPEVTESISIIPQVQQMELKDGRFAISSNTKVSYHGSELADSANMLAEYIGVSNKKIICASGNRKGFVLQINAVPDKALAQEGYSLSINKKRVLIKGNTAAGVFYGVQTIRQLLPVSIESDERKNLSLSLPCIEITDSPRYSWRGFMLDESRHFFGEDQVKKTLDIMAFYKLNRFHWHLTDMNGWRLEIKQYPKLTTVGSKGNWTDPQAEGGFYTQKQVRRIVEYARKRHIIVVPEIDMPGHATAANLAYPEFSGGGTKKYPEFTFNPGKEGTYKYLENILRETADLFPSQWIHFGGDEAIFASRKWNENADVKALMKKHNLKDLREVEAYFNRRMAKVIDRLDRVTVGWDEVVDAGLDHQKTVVMWWRHDKPRQLKKAIDKGFDVVLCPRIPCYFDFIQDGTHKYGRTWKGYCDLKSVYQYPEEPASLRPASEKQILGIQANLWTQRVHNIERFDYMTYPRLSALAETAWTEKVNKSFESYQKRLKGHMERYDVWGIDYFNPFDPASTPEPVWPVMK
jgi:hexosaminidase